MYQDLQVMELKPTQLNTDPVVPDSEQFTAKELARLLDTTERTIYKYANKLIQIWSWLPESTWRTDGIYTAKALEEMARLKAAKSVNEYALTVTQESGNYTQSGKLTRVETQSTVQTLTAKPIPTIPLINCETVDTGAIRSRTQQMQNINNQLGDAITQLLAHKVENKIEELDARLDDFFAEIEMHSKVQAVQKLQQTNQ
ncbi:hypothetical protein [Crocosphaera sp.]|uniref:hypothetical protein n=1 Tax=Crocosphaera sp. TaxID=2729996 RepID=UPI00257C2A1E|nr:hypothetical protein [Crocosphaera sp.]NQZ65210.1 hypothetical protein [Crocosphaera sp.]